MFLAGKIWPNLAKWFPAFGLFADLENHGSEPTKSSLWCSRFRKENPGLKMIENWRPSLGYQERVGEEKHSILWKADHYPPSMAAFFSMNEPCTIMCILTYYNIFIHYKIQWCFTGLNICLVTFHAAPLFGAAAWRRSAAQLGALFFPSFCSSASDFSRSRSPRHLTRAKLQIGMPLLRSCTQKNRKKTLEKTLEKREPMFWAHEKASFRPFDHLCQHDQRWWQKTCWFGFLHQTSMNLLWIHAVKGTLVLSNDLQFSASFSMFLL